MSVPNPPPQPPPPGVPEEAWSKNRLQQYAQRASLPLPVYQTVFEGSPQAPTFKSRVWVDGTCFASPNSFSTRKMAEQDAARHALIGIREKVKSEGPSSILQDTIFCKSIINEYAVKMNLTPTYVTNQSVAMLPIFVSSLVLNGVTYVGDAGKNKKEAEQFAARSTIISILDSESSTTMSEIVKSKFRFYEALQKVKDSCRVSSVVATDMKSLEDIKNSSEVKNDNIIGDMKDSSEVKSDNIPGGSVNKRKEIDVSEDTTATPQSGIQLPTTRLKLKEPTSVTTQVELLEPTLDHQHVNTQVIGVSSPHEFKKAKLTTSSEAVALPIVFVPPALGESGQAMMCSASGKKPNRKKKKAKKKT